MFRRCVMLSLVALLLVAAVAASAHPPGGGYGGKAGRFCGNAAPVPTGGFLISVGATRVSCRVAKKVAQGRVLRGRRFGRWSCPGTHRRSAFGHCHGKRGTKRQGAKVHWAPAE